MPECDSLTTAVELSLAVLAVLSKRTVNQTAGPIYPDGSVEPSMDALKTHTHLQ